MGVLVGRLLGWAWRGVGGLNGGWLGWLTAEVDLES